MRSRNPACGGRVGAFYGDGPGGGDAQAGSLDVWPAGTGRKGGAVQRVGDVLAELLDQYRARFPEINARIVETPAELT
jgi:hypothetical protein